MYSRDYKLHGENNFLDMMDALHVFIHIYVDMLLKSKISHVFFGTLPHEGADYILYLVAKAMNIPVDMFLQSQVPGKAFITNNWREIGSLKCDDKKIHPVAIERGSRNSPWYITKEKKVNWWIKALSALLLQWKIDKFFYRLANARKTRVFDRNYKKLLSYGVPEKKFVYFAMSRQPELSTASWGDEFVDQALALECLRKILPDDWAIVAKENPGQTYHSRGSLFFQRISHIPNLYYVGNEENTFELISNSEFVSTISGTVGTESLRFGKNVLLFGRPYYRDFPGVTRYFRDMALDDILLNNFDHEDIELAQAKLESNMVDVIVDCHYTVLVDDIDADQNAKELAEIIRQKVFEG
jgi:hypothetical protein